MIVSLRIEKARLLGYETFADYVLEDKMAGSCQLGNNKHVGIEELFGEDKHTPLVRNSAAIDPASWPC